MSAQRTAAVLTVLAFAGAAAADTVRSTFVGVGPGQNVTMDYSGNNIGTQAGAYNFNRDLGNPGTYAGLTPTYIAFCIDLTQSISNGSTHTFNTYDAADVPTSPAGAMGAARADLMAELFGRFYLTLDDNPSLLNRMYAAFQIAVWEIALDDGPFSLTSGIVEVQSANSSTIAQANAFLAALDGTGPRWTLLGLDLPGVQGYIVGLGPVIPAPAGAAVLGLAGLAAMRRRR